jgi:hypothetical protein
MKIEVDVPDVDGMPVELWLITLGRTGYDVHAVSFYNSDDATVVFERWWRDKHREAVKDAEQPKRRKRP